MSIPQHEPVHVHNFYLNARKLGEKVSDTVTYFMSTWRYVMYVTVFIGAWVTLNVVAFIHHWDVYPFMLLNLLFSTQATYAPSFIMMSTRRLDEKDRIRSDAEYETTVHNSKMLATILQSLNEVRAHLGMESEE